MDLGQRVRALRIKNELTLDELASRCELSKGFLSQLENNVTSPSFNTLQDIVEALGVSLEEFFRENKKQYVFRKEDYFVKENDDSLVYWIVPNAQKNDLEPIILILKPDGKSKELGPFEGQEFGYVLSGNIVLHNLDLDQKYIVRKNETFYFDADFKHQIYNPYKQDAKILWVTTPPAF